MNDPLLNFCLLPHCRALLVTLFGSFGKLICIDNLQYFTMMQFEKKYINGFRIIVALFTTFIFSFSGPYSWFQSLKSWLLRKLLSYMFPHGILYHPGQIQVLERCSKSKAPFLFLPVHKSPLDSIVIKSVLEKTPSRHDLKTFLASRPKEIQLKPGFQILDDRYHSYTYILLNLTSKFFSTLHFDEIFML